MDQQIVSWSEVLSSYCMFHKVYGFWFSGYDAMDPETDTRMAYVIRRIKEKGLSDDLILPIITGRSLITFRDKETAMALYDIFEEPTTDSQEYAILFYPTGGMNENT